MNTYKIPGTFYKDHMNRFWGEGVWSDYDIETERWNSRYVHVTLTDDQFDALLNDAEFYANGGGGFDSQYAGLMKSAQSTVRWLMKQEGETK